MYQAIGDAHCQAYQLSQYPALSPVHIHAPSHAFLKFPSTNSKAAKSINVAQCTSVSILGTRGACLQAKSLSDTNSWARLAVLEILVAAHVLLDEPLWVGGFRVRGGWATGFDWISDLLVLSLIVGGWCHLLNRVRITYEADEGHQGGAFSPTGNICFHLFDDLAGALYAPHGENKNLGRVHTRTKSIKGRQRQNRRLSFTMRGTDTNQKF